MQRTNRKVLKTCLGKPLKIKNHIFNICGRGISGAKNEFAFAGYGKLGFFTLLSVEFLNFTECNVEKIIFCSCNINI